MKNCTITFKIGETTRNIVVPEEEFYGAGGERTLPTWDFQARLGQLLARRKDEWNSLKRDIIQALKDNSAISEAVTLDRISGEQGLVPNVNFKYIQDTYPEIDFPSIDVPILLLDNLDVKSTFPVSGRVLDKKGKEIFVVRGDRDSLVKLAGYLQIREKILSGEYKDTLDDELINVLGKIAAKKDLSPEETLLQYLNANKQERQKDKEYINGSSIYTWMTYIAGAIRETPLKVRYNNPIINNTNKFINTNKNGEVTMSTGNLFNILRNGFPQLFTSEKDFVQLFNKRGGEILDILAQRLNTKRENLDKAKGQKAQIGKTRIENALDFYTLLEQIRSEAVTENNDIWGFSMLFKAINSLTEDNENPLNIKPVALKNKKLIFEKIFPSLKSAYGYGYETVASFTKEEERNGYNIYSQVKEVGNKTITYYYVSQYFINEDTKANRFLSIDEAQNWIDSHYIQQNLRDNSFLNLKQRYIDGGNVKERFGRTFDSRKKIVEGTIFKAIDMPIDIRSTNMKPEEYNLLDKTLQSFYDYIETLDFDTDTKATIVSKLDTPEKAVIFLSEMNRLMNTKNEAGQLQYQRNDNDKAKSIVNEISNKKPTYYYITAAYKPEQDKAVYRMRFTETDESSVGEKRYNKRTPILQLLAKIADVMNKKFGVEVNIVNEEQLTQMGIEDMNLVKAFIKDGKIYINSATARAEDAFHEYAHLFLGALKAIPEFRDSYQEFIDRLLATKEGQKEYMRNKKRFPKLSAFDIAEETVANLYGHYMEGNLPYELSSLFAMNDKLKKVEDTIFDRKDKGKAIIDFKGSFEGIWKQFNSDVAKALNDNINFIKDEVLQVQRQKDNWIKDQISKGNIIEDCE